MRVALFYHSLVSDWNNGNAHFLRGVVAELLARGHDVRVFEPRDGWSRANLVAEHPKGLEAFARAFPHLRPTLYDTRGLDLDRMLDGADLVIVHEWNEPEVVAAVGAKRAHGGRFRLLFHDTHHRMATDPHARARYDLSRVDGVLAYGRVLRDLYVERGWATRAWTWHEAADTRVFRPAIGNERTGDLVWIGNWGDGERTRELERFLFAPARALDLTGAIFGVRYPREGLAAIARTRLAYRGWIANHRVPDVFARHGVTVHVPRRPYARALPGIPTIRPFEALACGIPLVSAPWDDTEALFTAGEDYLVARTSLEMRRALRDVLHDHGLARSLAQNGLRTIRERHTCAHRVDELLAIAAQLGVDVGTRAEAVIGG